VAKASSVQRVRDALESSGIEAEIRELPDSTRTAPEAARAVGCEVGQILKSLVFRGARSGRPVLVAASGANRVDEEAVEAVLGEPIEKADADFVRKTTGFAIGGVPPLAHSERLEMLLDEDLLGYPEVWAAAGTPKAVMRLAPDTLRRLAEWRVVKVT